MLLALLILSLSLSSAYVPLPVLSARIKRYHYQLSQTNITILDRLTLSKLLKRDTHARYLRLEALILENITETDDEQSS